MHLEILTPEKKIFAGEAEAVTLPGSKEKGSFQILKGHAPIISSLQPGRITVKTGNKVEKFIVKSGFVEASNDNISVVVEGMIEKEKDKE